MANGGAREGAGRKALDTTKLRQALVIAATKAALPIADALVEKAKTGDVYAVREVYDRVLGKVTDNINLKAELQVVMDV